MFKKLRKKFIILSSSTVFGILFVVFLILNITTYVTNINTIKNNIDDVRIVLNNDDGSTGPKDKHFVSRYIYISLNEDNSINETKSDNGFSIPGVKVEDLKDQALNKNKEFGRINYTYFKFYYGDKKELIFVDARAETTSYEKMIMISSIIFISTDILITLIVILLSKKIIKPYEELYKKEKVFLTNASHELKTPITIIKTDLDVLKMDDVNNEWIDSIDNQTNRLSKLVNEMVNLYKVEEKKEEISKSEINISEVTLDVLDNFLPSFNSKKYNINIDVKDNIIFNSNEEIYMKILFILLDNANKYGLSEGDFSISLYKDKKKLILKVYNQTEEFNKDKLKCIFDRFYTLDEGRSKEKSGYGIGLSIAKILVEDIGGTIQASTNDNKSIEFKIILK